MRCCPSWYWLISISSVDAKELINQTLDYYKYKINNDLCTMEEIESVSEMLQKNLNVIGTVEDFSKFCEIPQSHVRTIISRRVFDKPKRRVYYRFLPFIKNVSPKLLKKKHSE